MNKNSVRTIIAIWLAWALIVVGLQAWAVARFKPQWPDMAQEWTQKFTGPDYQKDRPYLLDPLLNHQVAWDSEYYLAIAVEGYDTPNVPYASGAGSQRVPLTYAFLPFYPLLIRLLALPLSVFGLYPIATAALAGVLVSALGTLGGMLALFDLTRQKLGEDGALRAVFYLLIFPTGFFLVQVYTEGLFVGLAFGCLAMLQRKHWLLAAVLGVCATLTRAVGICLVIPMGITWLRTGEWIDLDLEWRQIIQQGIPLRPLGKALLAFSPLIAFLIWKFSYLGLAFDFVESNYFYRGFLSLGTAFYTWADAFGSMLANKNPAHTAYYLGEFIGLALGFVASIKCMDSDPEIAWFSFAVVFISWGSGPAQGIYRYVLGAPAVFITLARWGRRPVFDRAWTILSLALMALLAALFAFDMWVA